jgi:pyruvate dehydrogenase E2 component (dihydrolipoamide acetyltransferase)
MGAPIQALNMPRWGMTMTEGTVAGWLVQEGAAVSPDQEVVEIETTKITNVMEAGYSGTLRRIVVGNGEIVPVGTLIAVLADPSVPDEEVDAFIAQRQAESVIAGEEGGAQEPRLIDADGRPLNVLSLGKGSPVVLLHGCGGDLNNWLFNQPALAEEHAVHALDLPGHGASTLDVGAGDLDALADRIGRGLALLTDDPVHLVGHSLGGAVALKFAQARPGKVASLTLLAPAGLGEMVGENYIADFLAASRRRPITEVLGRLFADPGSVTRDMVEGVQRFKQIDGVPEALGKLSAAIFPDGRQPAGLASVLSSLAIPALVIWGGKDRILAPASHSDLPAGVRLEVIGEAGHMPHMEAATQVNRLIAAHMREAEA